MTDKPTFTTLSIVIPIYNEANTWRDLVARVEAVELPLGRQLILVDDCSKDGTVALAKKLGLTVVQHTSN